MLADDPQWTLLGAEDAVVTGLHYDAWHGNLVFVTTEDGFRYWDRRNGGHWTVREEPGVPGREVTALDGDPRLEERLAIGRRGVDGHGVLELSTDLGETSTPVYAARGGDVVRVEMLGFYEFVGWACTRAIGGVAGDLLRSDDRGATWTEVTGHGHHDITDICNLPTDEYQEIYVAGDAGVAHTADGGATWEMVNDGLPPGGVRSLWREGPIIAVVPDKEARNPWPMFAATDAGVYALLDDAIGWQPILPGTPARRITLQMYPWYGGDFVFVVGEDDHISMTRTETWAWEDITQDLGPLHPLDLVSDFDVQYAATRDDGVFVASWLPIGGDDVPPPAPRSCCRPRRIRSTRPPRSTSSCPRRARRGWSCTTSPGARSTWSSTDASLVAPAASPGGQPSSRAACTSRGLPRAK